MEEKFVGTLLGAAIGDSLGMTVEELPVDEVILHYGDKVKDLVDPHPSSPSNFLKAGENTSEFDIVMLVAKSIAEKGRIDIQDIIYRYVEWEEKEELHNYIDPYFLIAIHNLKNGIEIDRSSSSIEGALPAIPVGMFHYKNPILAVEGSKAIVMLTHRNEIVLDTASVIAVAIGELIQGRFYLPEETEYFIKLLETFVKKEETKSYLRKVLNLIKEDASYEKAINELGNGNFALEALSQALFIFLKTPENVEEAIINASNCYGYYGGDTDSIALLTGAFVGAYNGNEDFPERWINNLKRYNEIVEVARKLEKVAIH